MLAGYYTITSGLLTRQREIDVIGNNLVNAQTPGYRADRLLISPFEQELLTRKEAYNTAALTNGGMATSAVVGEVVPLFHSGTIKASERPMDMALNGAGFFNIQSTDGANTVYLTRNGQFDRDTEGYLVLPGYGRVLGEGGPIRVDDANIYVDPDGTVFNANGQAAGKLLLTVPPEGATVQKLENGMFQFPNGVQGQAAADCQVIQYNLELGNIDMNQEMTYLIEAQRGFQSCSSALQIIDALNRKAATQIGAL